MPDRSPGDDAAGTSPRTSTRGAEVGERSPRRRAARAGLALTAVVVTYYAAPVDEIPSSRDLVFTCAGLLAGLGVLVWVTVRQLRVMTQVEAGDPRVRLDVLALVVVVVVPLFALGYYALEQADPGQFADLATKTDALYFALSTLATVGFGDVHATEQLSRALVTLQMAFDVVFVTALASILTTQLRARAGGR
jgi:voltage-gated potassium channel